MAVQAALVAGSVAWHCYLTEPFNYSNQLTNILLKYL